MNAPTPNGSEYVSSKHPLRHEVVEGWLKLLGYRRNGPLRIEALRDGRSGAVTCRVVDAGEEMVLKAVLSESPRWVLERGTREVLFYSRLAGIVPVTVPEVVATYGPVDEPARGDATQRQPTSRESIDNLDDGLGGGLEVCSALLLKAYRAPEPVRRWSRAKYEAVAKQLARLHSVHWGMTDGLRLFEWLRRPAVDFSSSRDPAHAAWRALWEQERLAGVFDGAVTGVIENALECLAGSSGASSRESSVSLPLTLCHGDAHPENLLVRDDGAWVWSDWQEVGIGYGPDDVSFFYQRAAAAGGMVDLEHMLRTYHQELERQTGTRIDFEAIRRRALEYEVTTRLFQWPMHLEHAPESVIRAHVARVRELLVELNVAS